MKENEFFDTLCDLIEHYIGGNRSKYTMETRINFDLGLDGDDADEFLMAYSKKFNVDLSKLEFYNYFNVEGISIIQGLVRFLFSKKQLLPMTIGHLIDGINKGELL